MAITSRITLQDGTVITPDTLLVASHQATAEATDHPVEDGSAISDNIISKPRTVSATLVFSPATVGPDVLSPATSDSRPDQAFDALLGAMQRRERVTCQIDRRTYSPAALVGVTMPRTFEDGESRTIQLELKQILTVSGKTAAKLVPKSSIKSKTGKVVKSVSLSRADAAVLGAANLAIGNMGVALGYFTGAVF